jgi:hypothetical protein
MAYDNAENAIQSDANENVLIHVRFKPSGEVFTIDACPSDLSADDWFLRLIGGASDHYRSFAGGRGFFRVPRERFEALQA